MSKRISCHYLLFYLSASAILTCGLSGRIPRRTSCPSCNLDCPEALTVQLPWSPGEESNLQSRFLRDFSIKPIQNSRYSRLMQARISQDSARDNNILWNQNSVPFRNYRSSPRQEAASGNLFFKNSPYISSKPLNRREISSENKPASGYPLVRVPAPRRFLDTSEDLFFKNPGNKYSQSSLENRNIQDSTEDEEIPMNEMFIYRADRNTKPSWKDSKDTSFSNILPQRSFPRVENSFRSRREDIPDEERDAIKKSTNPINHNFAYPQVGYNPARFGMQEIKREPYMFPLKEENLNIRKPTKNGSFFDKWKINADSSRSSSLEQLKQPKNNFLGMYPAESEYDTVIIENNNEQIGDVFDNWDVITDSSQFSNLEQLKQAENDFLEMYPKENDTVIIENDNDPINYKFGAFPQDLNTWKPTKNGESFGNWNSATRKNSQESADIKRLQETEKNWLQMYLSKDTRHFEDEEDKDKEYFTNEEDMNQEYLENGIEEDTIATERDNYDTYVQDENLFSTLKNKGPFDNLNFTLRNLQGIQKLGQLGMNSEENDNKYFQDEDDDIIFEYDADTNIGLINRPPVINAYNAYVLPRYLNVLNNAKYPAEFSKTQESRETKNNMLRSNPVEERNKKLFEDETMIQNVARFQDLIHSKNIFDAEKYSNPAVNTEDINNNAQDEISTGFGPDLLSDIENPPAEPTEPTPRSVIDFSTSRQ